MKRHNVQIDEYVFSSCYGKVHFLEPKKGMLIDTELTGIKFTLHDLRRTFITIAESLNISSYAVKRLINHSMANDVTAGHIVWDVERIKIDLRVYKLKIKKAFVINTNYYN